MDKTKFIKNAITYFIGNILTKILTFLLIPLYTNYLSTADYGYYDLSISIISLIVPITFFQIWDGMFRFIYDYDKKEEKYKIVSNGLFIGMIGIIVYVLEVYIANRLFNIKNTNLIIGYGIIYALQYIYGTVARTYGRNKLYATSGVINTLINLTLNLILIKYVGMGLEALYISFCIGGLSQILMIEFKLKPVRTFKVKYLNKELIKRMVKFSLPIAVSTISIWLLTGYAKLEISTKLGVDYNGIFAIGTRFSSIIVLIISVLQMAWQEMSYSLINSEQKNIYYEKGLQTFYNIIFCGSVLAISITPTIFKYFVALNYYDAIYIMPIIYIYTALSSFGGFLGTQFLAEKNSKVIFYSVIISAAVNVILINLMIKQLQLIGACMSLMVSFLINVVIRLYLLRKMYKVKLDYKRVFYSIVILICYTILYYVPIQSISMIMFIIAIIISIITFKQEIMLVCNKIMKKVRI